MSVARARGRVYRRCHMNRREQTMRRALLAIPLVLLALAVTAVPAPAKHGDDRGNKVEGRITSVNRDARTFRLRDHDGRGTFTIRVTRSTEFERVRGFSALHAGRRIEATVRRSNGR